MSNFFSVILNFITSLVDFDFFIWFVGAFVLFSIVMLFRKLMFE